MPRCIFVQVRLGFTVVYSSGAPLMVQLSRTVHVCAVHHQAGLKCVDYTMLDIYIYVYIYIYIYICIYLYASQHTAALLIPETGSRDPGPSGAKTNDLHACLQRNTQDLKA